MADKKCHMCNSADIVYVDVLGLNWCRTDYADIYLGEL